MNDGIALACCIGLFTASVFIAFSAREEVREIETIHLLENIADYECGKLTDIYGQEIVVREYEGTVIVNSVGPDQIFGTEDDLSVVRFK